MIASGALLGLGRFDGVERCLAEPAVDAQARPRAHLDVHVRGALLDGEPQQSIQVQHADRGIDRTARLLKRSVLGVSVVPPTYGRRVFRAYQALLQPTAGQGLRLGRLLGVQTRVVQRSVGGTDRRMALGAPFGEPLRAVPVLDRLGTSGLEFGICPARGTLTRLDRAFAGFYRRCRRGETPGFPRFKSASRWDSVEYPDARVLEDRA